MHNFLVVSTVSFHTNVVVTLHKHSSDLYSSCKLCSLQPVLLVTDSQSAVLCVGISGQKGL